MTDIANLKAPAKINLGLRITGVRADGYHKIESLFAPVSLFDEIKIQGSLKDQIIFVDGHGKALSFENDTVTKSLGAFRENCGKVPPLAVEIKKNIPHGAGLGGGSSDGGTFLRFLKERFCPEASPAALLGTALAVGADVPFFLQSKPALVSGIGEIVHPVKIDPMAILIIRPPFEVATRKAFRWFDEECALTHPDADVNPRKINEVSEPGPHSLVTFSVPEIIERLINDLTKPVAARHPEITVMEKALSLRGALGTLMSGTGCSVYGIFRNATEAISVRESLQASLPSDYAYFVCETLTTDNVLMESINGYHRS